MSQSTRILAGLVLGLVAGIVVAAFAPGAVAGTAAIAQPIGTTWLNALQMTVVPLVFSLLVTGVAATAEAAQAGRLAGRAVGLYLLIMASSAVAAAFLTPLFLDLAPLPADSAAALRGALAGADAVAPVPSLVDFFTGIVPSNVVKAIAESNFLSMIIFALIFAFALMRIAPDLRAHAHQAVHRGARRDAGGDRMGAVDRAGRRVRAGAMWSAPRRAAARSRR